MFEASVVGWLHFLQGLTHEENNSLVFKGEKIELELVAHGMRQLTNLLFPVKAHQRYKAYCVLSEQIIGNIRRDTCRRASSARETSVGLRTDRCDDETIGEYHDEVCLHITSKPLCHSSLFGIMNSPRQVCPGEKLTE